MGNTAVTNVNTSGTITAGAVTYPNADGTSGQVLMTNGSGTPTWANLAAIMTTNNNTIVGYNALGATTTGADNTGLGYQALLTNRLGNQNTAIGSGADVASNNLTNATAIGSGAIVAASNTIQLGNTAVTNVNTSGTITAGAVTYPNADGTSGQVLTANGSGTPTWTSPAAGIPYTGATGPVDLGSNNLSTMGAITGNVAVSTEITNSFTISSANATTYNSKLLVCNPGAPITITIDNSNPIPVGFNIMVVQKSSAANTISFTAGNNATVINRQNFTATAGQYALVKLVYIGNGMFITSGDMQ